MSCPDCFRGSVHSHAEPTGSFETVHGIRTYVAGGSDPSRSKSTIVYFPDAFSLKLVNNKLLADQYAAMTGCRVLIPDVVRNGGLPAAMLDKMDIIRAPLPTWIIGALLTKLVTILSVLPDAIPFLVFGHPQGAYPKALEFARAVRAELPVGGKLGAAGFCWGGWVSTKMCTEAAVAGGSDRLLDAQFNGHPSYMDGSPEMFVDAVTKFKVPYASAVAANDFQFNEEVAAKTEAKVREATQADASTRPDYTFEFTVYKGCEHGFCVRAKQDDANMAGYRAALKQAGDWFQKHLN